MIDVMVVNYMSNYRMVRLRTPSTPKEYAQLPLPASRNTLEEFVPINKWYLIVAYCCVARQVMLDEHGGVHGSTWFLATSL